MASLDELRQIFFQECEEQLEELTDGLSELESLQTDSDPDPETINRMFRAVHSIKGGAASFSLDAITQYAHAFESILDELRSGKLIMSREIIPVFYRGADRLTDYIAIGEAGGVQNAHDLENDISEITALSSFSHHGSAAEPTEDCIAEFVPVALSFGVQEENNPSPQQGDYSINFSPTAALYSNGHEPVQIFRELETLGSLDISFSLGAENVWDASEPDISWHILLSSDCLESEIYEVFEFAQDLATIKIEMVGKKNSALDNKDAIFPAAQKVEPEVKAQQVEKSDSAPEKVKSGPKATVRVDLELVDELINMVGELVITQAVMTQSITESELSVSRQLATTLDDFKTLTRNIQERVMGIRAQSVKPLFQRMGRIVRETAQIAGKDVRFITDGEDTEVDRTVIERLVDPLTHILRNAIDHGLEHSDRRTEAGKVPNGSVKLSAAHRSGRVVIEVNDDGGGVNREKVLTSAIEKGLVSETAKLGDAEIDRLLFLPGFSTASSVTSLSGRGVGMDVVNSEIRRLGGRVSIISTPGQGTTISISLPLTLAVLDGMVVTVASQTMVVPISAITETIRPEASKIHLIGPEARMISVRDLMLPIIDLGTIFGFESERKLGQDGILLIVEDDKGEQFTLAVDHILDQRQVVIKSLESNYGHVPYVAAATILGDGQIALIIDLDEITNEIPTAASASLKSIRASA